MEYGKPTEEEVKKDSFLVINCRRGNFTVYASGTFDKAYLQIDAGYGVLRMEYLFCSEGHQGQSYSSCFSVSANLCIL